MKLLKNLRVVITYNLDKRQGIVNGMSRKVLTTQADTIFLKIANGNVISIHKVTYLDENGTKRVTTL